MLFRAAILERILSGTVTVALRRWRRPTVAAGGTLRTPAGVLSIDAVEACTADDITPADARAAGFASRREALEALAGPGPGQIYRIRFHRMGDDPRVVLRGCSVLSPDTLAGLRQALGRLDGASRSGPWTTPLLRMIGERDSVPAGELAREAGVGKDALKRRVRALKELGLTESLASGYRLSPRGAAVLAALG